MDRFIVREPKVGADYPQENQMYSFTGKAGNNLNVIPETMYFGGYGAELPVHRTPGFMTMAHVNAPHFVPNLPNPNQVMSGIDPRYLAAYADNSANYIAGQRQYMEREQSCIPSNGAAFANDYENRSFIGVDRNKHKLFNAQITSASTSNTAMSSLEAYKPVYNNMKNLASNQSYQQKQITNSLTTAPNTSQTKLIAKDDNDQKTSIQFPKSRTEKLRDLQKNGARAFSGPVEKVLKWHKFLQELGILVLYEIVAKCVSVQGGKGCAKTLVVRDDSGPAMQVVYYEIDFLLPELKPPCTIRVVGRMMPGTCRLQAYTVRQATGDDVSTLPRRAAVAAHHVSKLCKEFAQP